MGETFDIIVIGAGPAGLHAALRALGSKAKPTVLLVDKLVPWEKPIACAEGVWTDQFKKASGDHPEWIRLHESTVVIHSADGSKISHTVSDGGCIINRSLMQADLAAQCRALGAEVRLDTRVTSVGPDHQSVREVRFANGSSATARVVIDASGPVGGLGRTEKISWKPDDLEPAYFVIAENTGILRDAIHIYLGSDIAPGGYGWAFPRDEGTANIGIVVGKAHREKADLRKKLDSLIQRNFPDAKILHRHAGAIPCEGHPRLIAASRLLKAGDAASTVNPFTRAGIVEALESGTLAGVFAVKMLGPISANRMRACCKEYQNSWRARLGKNHGKLSRAKSALATIPDADYNAAFSDLSKIPQRKLTITRIIRMSLGRFPRLVFAMRHLM